MTHIFQNLMFPHVTQVSQVSFHRPTAPSLFEGAHGGRSSTITEAWKVCPGAGRQRIPRGPLLPGRDVSKNEDRKMPISPTPTWISLE